MNVVDSSSWLEFFADGPNANFFAAPITDTARLIVPSVSLLEVFKHILRRKGEGEALDAVASMRGGRVIPLDESVALNAAKLGVELRLPLADSIILATARAHQAVLWTQDSDFEGIAGVQYRAKG